MRSAGTRGKRGWSLLPTNVIASHGQTLVSKITPVVCDCAEGYSEMSTARWQGFRHSSPVGGDRLTSLLFTASESAECFPRAENPACMKRQIFPNCFPCGKVHPVTLASSLTLLKSLLASDGWGLGAGLSWSFLFSRKNPQ